MTNIRNELKSNEKEMNELEINLCRECPIQYDIKEMIVKKKIICEKNICLVCGILYSKHLWIRNEIKNKLG